MGDSEVAPPDLKRRVSRGAGYTFVIVCSASSVPNVAVSAPARYIAGLSARSVVSVPAQDEELSPSEKQELACALSNVVEFRPEPEDIAERDLERNLPSYHFPE